jgi:Cft2 family RNA processing exonuclease
VRGADDPRLGKIDAVLLTHVHNDHLGAGHQPAANAGDCGKVDTSVSDTPHSNTVNIAVGKKSKLLVGSDMNAFLAAKVGDAGGNAGDVQLVRFGASARIGGVKVATVPAVHTNAVAPAFLNKAVDARNYGPTAPTTRNSVESFQPLSPLDAVASSRPISQIL